MSGRPSAAIKIYGPGERSKSRPNRWCVARLYVGGRRRYVTIDGIEDKEEARSIAAEYLGRAQEAVDEDECDSAPRSGPETFGELAARYASDRQISRSEQAYVTRLVACRLPSLAGERLGRVTLSDLRPVLAREAAAVLYAGRTAKTMNRAAISPFSAIIHFGAENEWMPYLKVKSFKTIDRVTPRLAGGETDVDRLLVAAAQAKPKKGDRYKADHPYRFILLLFLFRQGWRISETLRLVWDQVDMVNGLFLNVLVDKGAVVKPSLPMHPQVRAALAGLPPGEPERADLERRGRVFPWVDRHNVYRWLNPWCAETGIHFRPHQARVEYASQLNEADQPPAAIADSCTWRGTKAVGRYIRTDARKARSANACAGGTGSYHERPAQEVRDDQDQVREKKDIA